MKLALRQLVFLYLPMLVLALCSTHATAQCPPGSVTFNNQVQLDWFLEQYPNCTQINGSVIINGDASSPITDLTPLINITTILGDLRQPDHEVTPHSLNGLNNLTYIGGDLYFYDTWVNDISALQNLTYVGGDVEMVGNDFSDFSPLNNIAHYGGNVRYVPGNGCQNNNFVLGATTIPGNFYYAIGCNVPHTLNGLSALTSVGGDFTIGSVNVPNLQGLNSLQSVGGIFSVSGSNAYALTSLNGLDSLTSIGGLSISYNSQLTDITALSQITNLGQSLNISNNAALTSLAGLENITSVSGFFNITSNAALTSMDALANTDLSGVTELNIYENYQLPLCHHVNICNFLYGDGQRTISNNASQCGTEADVMTACNQTYRNTISGQVRIDYNANGCDATDYPMGNIRVQANRPGGSYSTFTAADGSYLMYVPEGNYTVKAIENVANFTMTPDTQSVSFAGVGQVETIDFCAVAVQNIKDLRIVITPEELPRPGFESTFVIKYKNAGTTIANGTVDFTFDPAMMTFASTSAPLQSQNGNLLTWAYSDLLPFEERRIFVRFTVLEPPTVNLGQALVTGATVHPVTGDAVPADNTFGLNQTVVNSFDPNDKTSLLGNLVMFQNIGEYVYYKIRFQNTGTASAVNVKVVDTFLSQDASTFELIDMSHAGRVQMNNNVAEFIFTNINLADSTSDEPNSHGYVTFRIKPNFVMPGSYINNSASIYFDFNEPIITENCAILVDTDTDNDGIINSLDNCHLIANADQADSDNDGIGDVCDDNVEVNPPYAIGFDTATLDTLWRAYDPTGASTSVTVSNLNDATGTGNTIRLYTSSTASRVLLIAPRLNHVSPQSTISFWAMEEGDTSFGRLEIGFLPYPTNVDSFVSLQTINPPTTMTQYTLDMAGYLPSMGKNLAFLVKGRTVFIDDFVYESELKTTGYNSASFAMYPNPATESVNIESQQPIDAITVRDYEGRVLKHLAPNSDKTQVDVSHFSSGIYLLEIESDGQKQIARLIKR